MVEYFVIAALAVALVVMICLWPKTITLSDDAPENLTNKNKWLKLQNEGGKYVKVKDGKIYLRIVK